MSFDATIQERVSYGVEHAALQGSLVPRLSQATQGALPNELLAIANDYAKPTYDPDTIRDGHQRVLRRLPSDDGLSGYVPPLETILQEENVRREDYAIACEQLNERSDKLYEELHKNDPSIRSEVVVICGIVAGVAIHALFSSDAENRFTTGVAALLGAAVASVANKLWEKLAKNL